MSFVKKTLKGAAIVAGVGAVAVLIKKVAENMSDKYYSLDEQENDNCHDEEVNYREYAGPESCDQCTEETFTENDITEEDSIDEYDSVEDTTLENNTEENTTSEEDSNELSDSLETEK